MILTIFIDFNEFYKNHDIKIIEIYKKRGFQMPAFVWYWRSGPGRFPEGSILTHISVQGWVSLLQGRDGNECNINSVFFGHFCVFRDLIHFDDFEGSKNRRFWWFRTNFGPAISKRVFVNPLLRLSKNLKYFDVTIT